MSAGRPRFSKQTIEFIRRASRQKSATWLDRNREEFDACVRGPLQGLAADLAKSLRASAPGYHFPLKGLGRLKRSAVRARDYGSLYKSYVSFTITRPSGSRFDHHPSLFFMINSEDTDGDEVLLAGGLYMPSSRQLRSIRERISENAEPFEQLFRDPRFRSRLGKEFSRERVSTRPPRGFDPQHPKMDWLKLQGFFVWRSYRKKEYTSPRFSEIVAKDGAQLLRLNELLTRALDGRWPEPARMISPKLRRDVGLVERLSEERIVLPAHDF